ncbi:MAG: glycosyltransferase [Patescibacteria group bacterium]
MLLSIVIPTKNEAKNIGRLLSSIFKNKAFDSKKIEVIVVDNPDTNDTTREIVKGYKLAKLYTIGPERSAQRNHGTRNALGEYLYFVDADMEFTTNVLQEILDNLEPNKILVVKERIAGNSLYCRAINLEKKIYDDNDVLSAARVFARKVFDQVHGFNETMVSGEDWDLDRRVVKQKMKIVHLKNYVLHHEEDLGMRVSIRKKIYYAQKLKNYQVGIQPEVNPIYRYYVLFSRPLLIFKNPVLFLYLLIIKTAHFLVGFFVFIRRPV